MLDVVKSAVGVIVGVAVAACGAPERGEVATAARPLITVPATQSLAVAALSSAEIGNGARVRGHLAVLTASAAGADVLSGGVRLDVHPWADVGHASGSYAYAYSASFAWGSDVTTAWVHTNHRDLHHLGTISAGNTLEMPRFPRARPVEAGTSALVVPAGTSATLAASAVRGQVVVEEGATLRVGSGDFRFQDLMLEDGASLLADGVATVRVAGRLQAGDDVHVATATGTAGRLRVEVLGGNGGLGLPNDLPAALELGARGHVRAILFAPGGTLILGHATTSTGALVARHVRLDEGARIRFEDGLLPAPGSGPPLAFPDRIQATEDELRAVPAEGVLANDLDPHAYASLTAALVTHARSGTVTLSADGSFVYQPNPQFEGEDWFTYRASTAAATSVTATVTVVVDGTPDVPIITSIASGVAHVGQMWRYQPHVLDPDQGDDHVFTLVNPPGGTTIDAATGLVSWMPSSGQVGARTFELRVTDTSSATDAQTITVDVQGTPASSGFVLYAQESIYLRGKVMDGHVGVRNTGAGNTFFPGPRAQLEWGAVGYTTPADLFADSVGLIGGAMVHDVYSNDLDADAAAHHYGALAAFPPMPAMPTTSTVTPGTTAFVVAASTVRTLSATVSVGAVTVGDGGCLELLPGVYHFQSITIGFAGCVAALGPVEIRVAGSLVTGDYAYLGPAIGANIGTHQLRVELNAQGVPYYNPWATPAAADLGAFTSVTGTLVAPYGSVMFDSGATGWGSISARHIYANWTTSFYRGDQPLSNRPPVIVSHPPTTAEEGADVAYTAVVADPDANDTHTFSLPSAPSGMTVSAAGVVSWSDAVIGAHEVVLRVADAAGAYDTQRFVLVVEDVNDAPLFVSSPVTQATVGASYSYDAHATDADGDTLVYAIATGTTGLSIHAGTGVLSWTPARPGSVYVVLTAADPDGSFDEQDFTITVSASGNQPPAFVSSPRTGAVVLEGYASATRAVDPDPGHVVTYSLIAAPDGLTLDPSTGAIRWTPRAAQVGSRTLTIRASDGHGGTADQTTTLVVTAANQPPVFTSTPPTAADEGQALSYDAAASDPDSGDVLTFALESGPTGMSCDPASGLVTWTPTDQQVGTYRVVLRVADDHGHAAHQRFDITVTGSNDPPFFTSVPLIVVDERASYRYFVRASDPDRGDTLTYAAPTLPSWMSFSGSTLSGSPTAQHIGSHAVSLTVSDGVAPPVAQGFTVVVRNVNDPPRFMNAPSPFATQGAAYAYVPVVVDPDPGEVLTFELDGAPDGMTMNPATGALAWTPTARQVGVHVGLLRVHDQAGELDLRSFAITVADVNDPPVFLSTPVVVARENQRYRYRLRASDPDPQDTLVYSLVSGPTGMFLDGSTHELLWVPATSQLGPGHGVVARVTDSRGLSTDQTFAIEVEGLEACGLGVEGARCSALGFAHSVRSDSVPLGGVRVVEVSPTNTTRTVYSDGETGLVLLGGEDQGTYRWTFSAAGHVPVTRSAALAPETVTWVGVPRLAPLTDLEASISPSSGGHANDVMGRVDLSFGSSAVSSPATIRAAILDPQSLPLYPPRGWSPAACVYYTASETVSVGPRARFTLPAPVDDAALVILARYDEIGGTWISAGTPTTSFDRSVYRPQMEARLGPPGGYAILIRDQGTGAPATPADGQALGASTSTVTLPAAPTASGRVVPEVQTVTLDSGPEDYTGQAQVWIASSGAPSGSMFPARLFEQYVFQDGRIADVPSLPLPVVFYRYPRASEAPSGALSALFAVRPRHLLAPHELPDVHQRIELRASVGFDGAPLDASGGAIASGDLTLSVPTGALGEPALVRIEPLDASGFVLEGATAVRAFELEWSVAQLTSGARLGFDASDLPPNTRYVLARRELSEVQVVWQPVERLATNGAGDLSSREIAIATAADRLPGVARAGTYALFQVADPQGVVRGRALSPSAAPVAGVVLRADGTPWGAITGADGRYAVVAPAPGDVRVRAERPPSSDSGLATGALAVDVAPLTLDVEIGPHAPFVVSIAPAAAATHVPVVSAIDVVFSEPVAPASVAGVSLLHTVTSSVVPIQRSLSPDRRRLTLLPVRPLAFATAHTVSLTSIEDLDGFDLATPTTFAFTTAAAPTRAGQSARLVSYAPGAQHTPCRPYDADEEADDFDPTGVEAGVPGFDASDATITCVVGSAGVAEAGRPVVLVNDDTGVTATVLARPNGSFKGFIRGRTEDLLSATMIHGNGTRLTVPLGMQRFDDGRVALYSGGGVLTAPNPLGGEPFELIIEAGTIARRGVFRFNGSSMAELDAEVAAVPPQPGAVATLGFELEYQGDPMRESLDIRLPIDADDIRLPSGTTLSQAGFVLARQRSVEVGGQQVIGYDTMDRVVYEDGAMATHSFPMFGLIALSGATDLVRLYLMVMAVQRPTTAVTGYVVGCSTLACQAVAGLRNATSLATSFLPGGDIVIELLGLDDPVEGRPLPGAVVYATSDVYSPENTRGRLQPGQFMTVVNRDSRYALALPLTLTTGFSVRASHPAFGYTAAASASVLQGMQLGGNVAAHIVFDERESNRQASGSIDLEVSHAPARPPLWIGTATTGAQYGTVQARASALGSPPTDVRMELVSFTPFGDVEVAPGDVVVHTASQTTPGLGRSLTTFHVYSRHAGLARFNVTAAREEFATSMLYSISFGGATPAPPVTEAAPEPHDSTGPRAVRTWPPQNGVVTAGEPIEIELNEPIAPNAVSEPGAIELRRGSEPVPSAAINAVLSPDRRVLRVVVSGLEPCEACDTQSSGEIYRLTLSSLVTDLRGNALDQYPAASGDQPFVLAFRTSPVVTTALPGLGRGAGAVVHGGFAYVIDWSYAASAPSDPGNPLGSIAVYDIRDPFDVRLVRREALPTGTPRSLVVIPDFSYVRATQQDVAAPSAWQGACNCAKFTDERDEQLSFPELQVPLPVCRTDNRTLLAVTGGTLSPGFVEGSVSAATSQYLHIFDITQMSTIAPQPDGSLAYAPERCPQPANSPPVLDPRPIPVVISAAVTYNPTATTNRLKWVPPLLGYVESGSGGSFVNLVDLQAFILGQGLTSEQFMSMPEVDFVGSDLNGDGDYVDTGELPPLPGRLAVNGFAGRVRAAEVTETRQDIRDYALDADLMFVGAALGPGRIISTSTMVSAAAGAVDAAYRTLSKQDYYGSLLPRARSAIPFGAPVMQLDAVVFLPEAEILTSSGTLDLVDLVAMSGLVATTTSGTHGEPRLWLIDVTDPLEPVRLGEPLGARLPAGFGLAKTLERDPDDPNVLRVMGTRDVLRVDIAELARPDADGVGLHQAIIGLQIGGGSGLTRSGTTDYGVQVDGAIGAVFTGPRLSFVAFPDRADVLRPRDLRLLSDEAEKARQLAAPVIETALPPARLRDDAGNLVPSMPDPALHHYVMVRAPGESGASIGLLVEGLDAAGQPLPNPCGAFAPVRGGASSTFTRLDLAHPLIEPLTAWRMSNNPSSGLYNVYLSDPFVLAFDRLSAADVGDVREENDRQVYTSSDGIRVSLDPAESNNPVLGRFASVVRREVAQLDLGPSIFATAYPAHRILGRNPAAVTGAEPAPGTDDMVSIHSGELDVSVEDLELPSPRMPLSFARHYRGQDEFEGPFGPGWDFDFNQRVVEARAEEVPAGIEIPLVTRGREEDSTVARSGDVVFHNGRGDTILYRRFAGSGVPPEYSTDPLMGDDELDWNSRAHTFYIPQAGVFDALVRFDSGQFARLTPEGTQYWYTASGRLEKVYHRYAHNRHELSYGERGELLRIEDTSTGRWIELGYYRLGDDPQRTDVDVDTSDLSRVGRIARLLDDGGRDVLYHYDAQGRLERVEGVQISTVPAGSVHAFTGRRLTRYVWPGIGCGISAVEDGIENGLSSFAATSLNDGVVRGGTGASGAVSLTPPISARSLDGAETTLHNGDGDQTYTFNAYGLPQTIVSSGENAPAETERYRYRSGVLLERIDFPKGNSIAYTFEDQLDASAPLRSRGNIVRVTRDAGPLDPGASPPAVEQRSYDRRYNIPAGIQVDAAGHTTQVTLQNGGRDIGAVVHRVNGASITYTEAHAHHATTGWPESTTTVDGLYTGYAFDPRGNLEEVRSGDVSTRFGYACATGAHGFPCSRDNVLADDEVLVHNELGDLVSRTQGAASERIELDRNGLPRRIVRALGVSAQYVEEREYDQRGFMRHRSVEALETDGTGQEIEWRYLPDDANRVRLVTHDDGQQESFVYDHRGRVHRRQTGERVETSTYDRNGNLETVSIGGQLQRTMFYDGFDRLMRVESADGGRVEHHFDGNGHPLLERAYHTTYGPLAEWSASLVDDLGRPLAWRVNNDAFSAAYRQTNGPLQRATTHPSGAIERETYDASGAVTARVVEGLSSQVIVPDTEGRPITITTAEHDNTFVDRLGYTSRGQLASVSDGASVRKIGYEYRLDGALVAEQRGASGLAARTEQLLSVAGESLGRVSAEGVRTEIALDQQRRLRGVGPSSARRRTYQYDGSQRLTQMGEPDGTSWIYSTFDAHGLPQQVTQPGGTTVALGYDPLGRLASRVVRYGSGSDTETFAQDPLDRLRSADNATAELDIAWSSDGRSETLTQTVGSLSLSTQRASDATGARAQRVYPAGGPTVVDGRDVHGALVSSAIGGTEVVRTHGWAMAGVASDRALGPLRRLDSYDGRRRLVSRSYWRESQRLADLRHEYDSADRETTRQDVVRQGRADLFGYDRDSRLVRVETGARLELDGDGAGPWTIADRSGWRAGWYGRSYGYSTSEPDLVRTTSTSRWGGGESTPVVGVTFGTADALGHLETVDGQSRGRDALGNVSSLPWGSGTLTITHDSESRPREVMRPDGVGVRYGYRADGLRATREYVCPTTPPPGCSARSEVLLYSGLQLLEVREVSPTARVRARYYYEDEGEVPYAADLWNASASSLSRYYYLTDKQGSVIAVTDATGSVVERVSYDAWGHPSVEPADVAAPSVSVVEVVGGDLLVRATEAVLPRPAEVSSNAAGVVTSLTALSEVLSLVVPGEGDRVVSGTWRYAESAGIERGRVLRFTPSETLTPGQSLALVVGEDGLIDSWSNGMSSARVSLTWGSGVLWSGSSTWTGTGVSSVSGVGNEVLFQSHQYEWSVGLYHMRARLMEPRTGLFLERDPVGYADAANVYALMGGDTVNNTDPTGGSVLKKGLSTASDVVEGVGKAVRSSRSLARGATGINLIGSRAKKLKASLEARSDALRAKRLAADARAARTQPYGRVDVPPSAKGRTLPGTPGRVTGGDSTELGKNMLEAMGLPRSTSWTGYEAQHLIPSQLRNHPVIQKVGMDFDHASNGLFLPNRGKPISALSRHQGFHSTYNRAVGRALDRMDPSRSVAELEGDVLKLQDRLRQLNQSGYPLYPRDGATDSLWTRLLGL